MLEQLGKPYQSSKGRRAAGWACSWSVNVARTLGGSVAARNRERGGALGGAALAAAGRPHAGGGRRHGR
jgi:two-component system sensor histidine kinase RegB